MSSVSSVWKSTMLGLDRTLKFKCSWILRFAFFMGFIYRRCLLIITRSCKLKTAPGDKMWSSPTYIVSSSCLFIMIVTWRLLIMFVFYFYYYLCVSKGLSDSGRSCAATTHYEMQNGHMVVVTFSSGPWIHILLSGCQKMWRLWRHAPSYLYLFPNNHCCFIKSTSNERHFLE